MIVPCDRNLCPKSQFWKHHKKLNRLVTPIKNLLTKMSLYMTLIGELWMVKKELMWHMLQNMWISSLNQQVSIAQWF
jgi:hypothetical protein